jgi:hypothetical protein
LGIWGFGDLGIRPKIRSGLTTLAVVRPLNFF